VADLHQTYIGRQPEQPRRKGGPSFETGQPSVYLQEGFLESVFRILRVAKHADGQAINLRLIPGDQRFKSLIIAVLDFVDKNWVGQLEQFDAPPKRTVPDYPACSILKKDPSFLRISEKGEILKHFQEYSSASLVPPGKEVPLLGHRDIPFSSWKPSTDEVPGTVIQGDRRQ
jgi:hypothetical protein